MNKNLENITKIEDSKKNKVPEEESAKDRIIPEKQITALEETELKKQKEELSRSWFRVDHELRQHEDKIDDINKLLRDEKQRSRLELRMKDLAHFCQIIFDDRKVEIFLETNEFSFLEDEDKNKIEQMMSDLDTSELYKKRVDLNNKLNNTWFFGKVKLKDDVRAMDAHIDQVRRKVKQDMRDYLTEQRLPIMRKRLDELRKDMETLGEKYKLYNKEKNRVMVTEAENQQARAKSEVERLTHDKEQLDQGLQELEKINRS